MPPDSDQASDIESTSTLETGLPPEMRLSVESSARPWRGNIQVSPCDLIWSVSADHDIVDNSRPGIAKRVAITVPIENNHKAPTPAVRLPVCTPAGVITIMSGWSTACERVH